MYRRATDKKPGIVQEVAMLVGIGFVVTCFATLMIVAAPLIIV